MKPEGGYTATILISNLPNFGLYSNCYPERLPMRRENGRWRLGLRRSIQEFFISTDRYNVLVLKAEA